MKMTLKAARINKGLSQQDAADALKVSRTTIQSWETYKSYPTVAQIPIIESVYGVRYNDLDFWPQNCNLGITNEDS